MEHIKCKKCGFYGCVKAGFIKGKQRYKCTGCLCRFLPGSPKRHSTIKRWCLLRLYTEGMCIRGIGRYLRVSHTTVIRWIRQMAEKLRPPTPTHARHIEIDELYLYVGSKKRKRWLWLAICRDTKRILASAPAAGEQKPWRN